MATKECLCLTPRNVCATIYQGCRHLPSLRGLATVGGNSRYFWALANAQLSSTFIWLRSLLHFYIVLSPLSSGAKNALLRSDCFNETLPPIFSGDGGCKCTHLHAHCTREMDNHSVPLLFSNRFLPGFFRFYQIGGVLYKKVTQIY